MWHDVALYASFLAFSLAMLYKISNWFRRSLRRDRAAFSPSQRLASAVRGLLAVLLSARLFTLLKVLVLDGVLQVRLLKESPLRWVMHMLIYGAFMYLLLMHALEGLIPAALFSDYASTRNPFMFLRDLFGVLLIAGLGIAVFRRLLLRAPRLSTHGADGLAIFLLALVICSGLLLEATKITSRRAFEAMVEEYAATDDEEELAALEAFWAAEFGLVSKEVEGPFEEGTLEQGMEVHEMNCAGCHSRPTWAFAGYGAARLLRPLALWLDRAQAPAILWHVHFLACLVGLALVPFSKMFHLFASPVSLLAGAAMAGEGSDPANIETRRIMELDACTHCGACSRRCSVWPSFLQTEDRGNLPSERMVLLKEYVARRHLDGAALRSIQEGVQLCTGCERCIGLCPVGIDLPDLWSTVREEMFRPEGTFTTVLNRFPFARGLTRLDLGPEAQGGPLDGSRKTIAAAFDGPGGSQVLSLPPVDKGFRIKVGRSSLPAAGSFAGCFACENCSTVCPVVQNYPEPEKVLGLLPHQIMRAFGLGLRDLALGSNMIWDCTTCYQCQEHCPQGVKVTDVLFLAKNLAIEEALSCAGERAASPQRAEMFVRGPLGGGPLTTGNHSPGAPDNGGQREGMTP